MRTYMYIYMYIARRIAKARVILSRDKNVSGGKRSASRVNRVYRRSLILLYGVIVGIVDADKKKCAPVLERGKDSS